MQLATEVCQTEPRSSCYMPYLRPRLRPPRGTSLINFFAVLMGGRDWVMETADCAMKGGGGRVQGSPGLCLLRNRRHKTEDEYARVSGFKFVLC